MTPVLLQLLHMPIAAAPGALLKYLIDERRFCSVPEDCALEPGAGKYFDVNIGECSSGAFSVVFG